MTDPAAQQAAVLAGRAVATDRSNDGPWCLSPGLLNDCSPRGFAVSKLRLAAAAILSAATLAFAGSAAIAANTLTVYGTASGESGPQYTAGTILVSDTVQFNVNAGRKVQRAAAEKCSAGVGFGIYSVRSFAPRIVLSGRRSRPALPSPGIFEPVALALRLEDVAAVREAVEGGPCEPLAAEHLGPLLEGEIRGHDQALPLVGCR